PGRTKDDDGLPVLVLRRGFDLIAGQFQGHDVAFFAGGSKTERIPVYRNFPAADPEKSAEVDHGGTHAAVAIDDDVDDAPHVLVGAAAHVFAEDALRLARSKD